MRVLRNLGIAMAIALAGLVTAPNSARVAYGAAPPPPECRYDDVLTQNGNTTDWPISLLDSTYMLARGYVPPKLVAVSNARIDGGGKVRSIIVDDLTAMAKAARQAGAPLRVVSAYRSWRDQKYLFEREIRKYGTTVARESVARPGHSEHQLGTTIDFGTANTSKQSWAYNDWAKTTSGAWIKANGWKYGFLLSYPSGEKAATCYRYEPWHYRYVGRDMAADVKATGLTLREYIWKNFE